MPAPFGRSEGFVRMVFSSVDSGVVWADPGLDITTDIIKKLDAAAAAAPKK